MKEKNFLDSFNQIGFLDKDKEIKFFSSIGDEQISEEAISNINDDYTNYKNKVMEDLEEMDSLFTTSIKSFIELFRF